MGAPPPSQCIKQICAPLLGDWGAAPPFVHMPIITIFHYEVIDGLTKVVDNLDIITVDSTFGSLAIFACDVRNFAIIDYHKLPEHFMH